eukprot:646777-Pyramimonas_sp.AAC.1
MGPPRGKLGALGVCAAACGHLLHRPRGNQMRVGQLGGRGGAAQGHELPRPETSPRPGGADGREVDAEGAGVLPGVED